MSAEGCVRFCCTMFSTQDLNLWGGHHLEWSPAYWQRTRPRGVTIGCHILPSKANLMATPNFHHLKEISSIQKESQNIASFSSNQHMKFCDSRYDLQGTLVSVFNATAGEFVSQSWVTLRDLLPTKGSRYKKLFPMIINLLVLHLKD